MLGTGLQFETILYEKQGPVAVLTINREAALNSVSAQVSREMQAAFADYRDDDALRALVLTGSGAKAFSTGMDLVATAAGEDQFAPGMAPFGGYTRKMPLYKPVIAAINGFCLAGGLELALAADIRICVPEAKFGLPEVRWAIMPGAGGTQRLPRAIPEAWANYMVLTGEQIDAETAQKIGLVSHIVPRDQLLPKAMEIAHTIAERGPLAVRTAKEAIQRGRDMPLDHGLAFEEVLIRGLFLTQDAKEGPKAFAEKRKPEYHGR